MLYSQLFGRSSKTEATASSVRSHRLLTQAGYIRESTAGRYYFLPLGRRVQLKLIDLIRQEMDATGALEVVTPVLHPLTLWRETNRDQAAGFELMQLKDRRGQGFALGGTAEEMFVDLVRKFNLSYRDLPFNLYQFGAKFRDELRARGGLLRTREFIMKDAYSFSTEEQFEAVYRQMKEAYQAIFDKLGLETKIVPADGGYIGGQYCHEFVVDSDVGESVYLEAGDYLAHEDIAVFDKSVSGAEQTPKDLELVKAVRGPTMADSQKLHRPQPLTQHIKNVIYLNEKDQIILACLRGDLEVNETKLTKLISCNQLRPLTAEEISAWLDSCAGFLSAVDLKLKSSDHQLLIVADDSLESLVNGISGGNRRNYDYVNINLGRDFQPDFTGDIALAKDGHRALNGQTLKAGKGIEVGNIFQLGYHYSKAMKGVDYVDEEGRLQKYYMGCYGIGIGRTIATVAEVLSDEAGLIWPPPLTPYHVYLAALNDEPAVLEAAQNLMRALKEAGLEVLYDDRSVSAGEKLTNADLLGFPLRAVVSPKSLKDNQVELKLRQGEELQLVKLEKAASKIRQLLQLPM